MEKGSRNLAVVFPGIGYHADKPLLYYASRMAEREFGCELIEVVYKDMPPKVFGSQTKMREAFGIAFRQAEQQLFDVKFGEYDRVVFISKSVGTAVAASCAGMHGIRPYQIFYTPLVESFEAIRKGSGIAFHGTKDPWAENEAIRQLCDRYEIPLTEIPDGNHSLETGNVLVDIQNLETVMEKTHAYLKERF